MIAHGRNALQVYIDETAMVLERILTEVPLQIKSSFRELERIIEKETAGLPYEEAWSLKSSMENGCRIDDESEMLEAIYKSVVVIICSYFERTLKLILPDDVNYKRENGESNIDALFRAVTSAFGLHDLGTIDSLWTSKKQFTRLRNDIIHNKKYDTSLLNEDYIKSNLEMVKNTLRTIADKNLTYGDKNYSYYNF